MAKISFLIDGFNLYHALNYNPVSGRPWINPFRYRKYKWLNLAELCKCYLNSGDSIEHIFYFTALAYWKASKVSKHQLYIRALQDQGVQVVYGVFKERTRHCNTCNADFNTHEEKQTDVNIAVSMVTLVAQEMCEKVILISGDSDIIPAVNLIQDFYTGQVGVVVPIGKASESLKRTANFHYRMREKHLLKSQFANPYIHSDGSSISRPASWI